jgi:hypothetical protein
MKYRTKNPILRRPFSLFSPSCSPKASKTSCKMNHFTTMQGPHVSPWHCFPVFVLATEERKRCPASGFHCLTSLSEPTRTQLQNAAPRPPKRAPEWTFTVAGACETAKHHATEARRWYPASGSHCLTHRQETSCKMQLRLPRQAPEWTISERLQSSRTLWHWRAEAVPGKPLPVPNVAFWTDKKLAPKMQLPGFQNELQNGASAGACARTITVVGACKTAKHHATEARRCLASGFHCPTSLAELTRD